MKIVYIAVFWVVASCIVLVHIKVLREHVGSILRIPEGLQPQD